MDKNIFIKKSDPLGLAFFLSHRYNYFYEGVKMHFKNFIQSAMTKKFITRVKLLLAAFSANE